MILLRFQKQLIRFSSQQMDASHRTTMDSINSTFSSQRIYASQGTTMDSINSTPVTIAVVKMMNRNPEKKSKEFIVIFIEDSLSLSVLMRAKLLSMRDGSTFNSQYLGTELLRQPLNSQTSISTICCVLLNF